MLYPIEVDLSGLDDPKQQAQLMEAVVAAITQEADPKTATGDVTNLLKQKLGQGWYVHKGTTHYAIHAVKSGKTDKHRLVMLAKASAVHRGGYTP